MVSDVTIARAAHHAGFTGKRLQISIAVALAESGGDTNNASPNTDGSIDRGEWQFNNKQHREVSNSCAYSLTCSARATYRLSRHGRNWQPWTTYNNGDYRAFMARAKRAMAKI